MLKIFNLNKNNSIKNLDLILNKRKINQKNKSTIVRKILLKVKNKGDKALIDFERKFSNIKSRRNQIKFSNVEINKISKGIKKELKKSIDVSFNRIKLFHSKQKFFSFKYKDKFKNELSYNYSPIEKVGVYVPGGTASYLSTVLMNCIPAMVLALNKFILQHCLGKPVNPAIIYAAKKCGVKEIYKIGGAHSIAGLAYELKQLKK